MRILFAAALFVTLGSHARAGEKRLREAARRFIREGDHDALVEVRRARNAAWPVLEAIASAGRRFPSAPTGRLSREAALTHDPDFSVRYELFVPPDYDPATPHPLLLYVHGTYNTGATGMRRILPGFRESGWIVLCPSSEIRDRGWTFTAYERNMQLDALRDVQKRYNVDPQRIYLCGYSRGGHASWDLPLRRPGVFAASCPMAGGPRIRNIRFLPNLAHTRLRAEYGALDEKGLVWCVRKALETMKALDIPCTAVEHPDRGHQFPIDAEAIRAWLEPLRRERLPRRITCACSDPSEGRSFWIRLDRLETTRAELPAAGRGRLVLGGEEVEVVLRGVPIPRGFRDRPDEARWAYFVEKADAYKAWVEAEVEEGNVVRARTKNVRTFTILVSKALFDLEKPITVHVNGKRVLRRRVSPSPEYALRFLARSPDWTTLYVDELSVHVR